MAVPSNFTDYGTFHLSKGKQHAGYFCPGGLLVIFPIWEACFGARLRTYSRLFGEFTYLASISTDNYLPKRKGHF
jgi:hypothetical protein